MGTRRVATSIKVWSISREFLCFRWKKILLSRFKFTLKNPFWFIPCWSVADWKERLKLQPHLPTHVFNVKSYLSVWLCQSRNFPVTLLYAWIFFYTAVLKELRRVQRYLLLWIYCLGCVSSCPSGIATFARKYLDFFHLEEPQFNHPVRSPHLDGLSQWFKASLTPGYVHSEKGREPTGLLKVWWAGFWGFSSWEIKTKILLWKRLCFDKLSKCCQKIVFSYFCNKGLGFQFKLTF